MKPAPFTHCVFDAYGTLFDVHSAVGRYRESLGEKADAVSVLWRSKQLEYTWLRSLMRQHVDFWQITTDALDYAFSTQEIENPELQGQLLQAYHRLDCYPEVPETLQSLKDRGYGTAILSNGSPEMLSSGVRNSRLGDLLDAVLSVEDVGVFKPDPRVYQLAVERLQTEPGKILFFSSNAWDVCGSAAFGFQTIWINRFSQKPERLPGRHLFEIQRLDG
ncbi:MAG: haloacid dehalogenase type II, partial [SAR324 cluster bacterium]|nr:haloacid dehalogenase type II [SAR324 cluster bacterium]